MSDWKSATFRGSAFVGAAPQFVDQCLGLQDPVHWGSIGPVSLQFYPHGDSLRATFAWRNEVFACAFPTRVAGQAFPRTMEDPIRLCCSGKEEEAREHYWSAARRELARLLDQHLERRLGEREAWADKAKADREEILGIVTA